MGVSDAVDYAVSLVRYPGRGGDELLRLGVPAFQGDQGEQGPGQGDVCRVRGQWTAADGAERRPRVQVQRGRLALRRVRDAGRDRHALGEADRGRWTGRPVRLAQGPIRAVLADRADVPPGP